jgi:hypothetical protein
MNPRVKSLRHNRMTPSLVDAHRARGVTMSLTTVRFEQCELAMFLSFGSESDT